jgi:rSAM/selenodomain-associated transferase 2
VNSHPPFLSIIIPVLNEARVIGGCLEKLRRVVGVETEIVVVDGGSSDGTRLLAEALANRVIVARPGRACQMNAGAEIARGEVFWFLHADSEVPADSISRIEVALREDRVAGGCFRLRYARRELIYRVSDSLGNVGVNMFGFALGDHGIFCRRSAFFKVAGYPEVPILEDAEIYRGLRGEGRMLQVRAEIISDPRAYEAHGRYWTTAVYFSILALYVLGVPIGILNHLYRRFRGQRSRTSEAPALAPAAR